MYFVLGINMKGHLKPLLFAAVGLTQYVAINGCVLGKFAYSTMTKSHDILYSHERKKGNISN